MNKLYTPSFIMLVLSEYIICTTPPSCSESRPSISFENADLRVEIRTPAGELRMAEAFASPGETDPRKMQWLSLGVPRLVARRFLHSTNSSEVAFATTASSADRVSPIELVLGGFRISVETLNMEVKRELAKRASLQYGTVIHNSQFLSINKHLNRFECEFEVFDKDANQFEKLNGVGVDFANPVVIFFSKLIIANALRHRLVTMT